MNVHKSYAIYAKGSECHECGIEFDGVNAAIFDFHHIDPTQKEYNIATMKGMTREKVDVELAKTIMVCSNCHRLIHSRLKGNRAVVRREKSQPSSGP